MSIFLVTMWREQPPPPWPLMFAYAALYLGGAGMLASLFLRTATGVTVAVDGTLTIRRPCGALRTHVTRVQRIRRSSFFGPTRPGSLRRPYVLIATEGAAYLTHSRDDIGAIISAVQHLHPTTPVDMVR